MHTQRAVASVPESGSEHPQLCPLALAARTLRTMAARRAPLSEESEVAGDGLDFLQARLILEQSKTRGKLRLTLFRGPL